MPFCPRCGAQLPEGAQFCGECGTPLTPSAPQPVQPAPQPMQQAPWHVQPAPQPQPKKKKKLGPVILVLLLLAIAGAAYYLWTSRIPDGGLVRESGSPASSTTVPFDEGFLIGDGEASDVPSIQDLSNAGTLPPGFQRFEDMSKEELSAYLNNMLKEQKADLRKERAKGAAADPRVIVDIQKRIETTEQQIRDYGL